VLPGRHSALSHPAQDLPQALGEGWAESEDGAQGDEDANARLSAVEAKLAGLDEEIKKFAPRWSRRAEDEARIKASLAEESARIVRRRAGDWRGSRAGPARLRNFAADLAIEQAAKQMV
jgi:hypothetical protein